MSAGRLGSRAEPAERARRAMPEKIEQLGKRRRRRSRHRNTDDSDLALLDGAHTRMPRPGDLLADKYQIDDLLGRGGMGAVYSATHRVSGKRAAVKWMLPAAGHAKELSERFIREARATARIDHPNVVDIYDVGQKDGSAYLVMELMHGESLAQRLDREPVTAVEAVALLMPALRGVAAAHAQGVIHRDLKPDNIFLCWAADGEARDTKVLDFGISKIVADERRDLAMTASGTVMGTPYYMSPEQIRGFRDVDARSDVYAFGVILYEMLADCFPFDAETYNELILKIATTDPVALEELNPGLNPQLVEIVKKAMAREPAQRFQSVTELAEALEPFAGGVTFRMSRTPQGPLPIPTFRTGAVVTEAAEGSSRVGLWLGVGVIAGLLVLGGVGLWWSLREPARDAQAAKAAPAPGAAAVAPAPVQNVAAAAPAVAAPVIAPAPTAPAAAIPAGAEPPADLAAPAAAAAAPSSGAPAAPSSARAARKRDRAAAAAAAPAASAPAASAGNLPQDWDDRLSTQAPAAGRSGAAAGAPRKAIAGKLTADDL